MIRTNFCNHLSQNIFHNIFTVISQTCTSLREMRYNRLYKTVREYNTEIQYTPNIMWSFITRYKASQWPILIQNKGLLELAKKKKHPKSHPREWVNSLGPSDAIWRHRSGSTLAQVMACCLTAPSHYLTQCWLIISKAQWHSSEGNFIRDASATIH